MTHKFVDRVSPTIINAFRLDFNSVIERGRIYKSEISTQCTKCEKWNMMTIDALTKRLASNNIPYICRKCVVTESMKKPNVRKKCQRNSRSFWRNEIIKESMVRKSNNTKFLNKLDKAFED